MGLWAEECGLSRSSYNALQEVLRLLEPNQETGQLPESVQTLKKWAKAEMPLLQLRKKSIPLIPEKMATSRQAHTDSSLPREDLYFFDPKVLFSMFLGSDIAKKMHKGFAHFVDTPTEIWHGNCWASSIRMTSGNFAHYSQDSTPIYPSDFARYSCPQSDCDCRHVGRYHLGRVVAVGRDYHSTCQSKGAVTIKMQKVLRRIDLLQDFLTVISPPVLENELFLLEDAILYLPESSVMF